MSLLHEQWQPQHPERELGYVSPSIDTLPLPISHVHTAQMRSSRHFKPRTQTADRHVVIPDIHGEHAVLQKIIDHYYEQSDVDFVFLGDLIDRKGVVDDPERGVYKTLDLVGKLGRRAVITMANHEWLFLGSSHALEPTQRREITREWLGATPESAIEKNVLLSYGLNPEQRDEYATMRLRSQMARAGHLGLLLGATPYYETTNFIATHAGILPDVDWAVQREYLETVGEEMDEGLYYDRPGQWFSMKLATSTAPISATDKIVVSGHAHVLGSATKRRPNHTPERVLHNGKRVRLASTLNAPSNAPAFVWQDWDQEIVNFVQDDKS